MINTISTSVSGLMAAGKKMSVAANNIANVSTVGSLDPSAPEQPYHALTTVDQSTAGGGVQTVSLERNPPFFPIYSPDSPFADAEGLVGAPNVNLDEELTKTILAKQSYTANAKVIGTSQRMHESLMDAIDQKA